jgi:hypothetical protein
VEGSPSAFEFMSNAHAHLICVHYPGQDEPAWCDTLEEAVTYIIAENVGRGRPPFLGLQTIMIVKNTDE